MLVPVEVVAKEERAELTPSKAAAGRATGASRTNAKKAKDSPADAAGRAKAKANKATAGLALAYRIA